jgi:hypothetical protein
MLKIILLKAQSQKVVQHEDSFFGTTATFPTGFPSTSNCTPCLAILPEALRDYYLCILASLVAVY